MIIVLWFAEVNNYDYDMYDSCVIRAKTEQEARALAKTLFSDWQGPIKIEYIDPLGKTEFIIKSFNAG